MSFLDITSAVALNELVNAPDEFVSRQPYLVVARLDWIQTRYLVVRCRGTVWTTNNSWGPDVVLEQDPSMTPLGSDNQRIQIPLTAISPSRRSTFRLIKMGNKQIQGAGTSSDPVVIDDDVISIATLAEDLEIFKVDDVPEEAVRDKVHAQQPSPPVTDFVPGALDHSSLLRLKEPAWATSSASRRLQLDFKTLLKVQGSEPLHEVGWYIDPEHFDNVYQWIVELHSFDLSLPLAQDMKAEGITSVVLELRFGKDYPISPPFVRVIRPRFLPFFMGGGGHVTGGGALCMEVRISGDLLGFTFFVVSSLTPDDHV